MSTVTIHYQDKSSGKYKSASFDGDERDILRELLRWSLYAPNDDDTRELIVPHRVTGVVVNDGN